MTKFRDKLNDTKIGELTITVIEKCEFYIYLKFFMIKNILLVKTILRKLKIFVRWQTVITCSKQWLMEGNVFV